ncbi:hypothetical protein ACFV97_12175 [Streptomyces sp. NPDC059913]|uniref:hypothetical protein n=1 Tax=unclassified Streptomyces TaxID=2593676 RepID=UPI00364F98FB
MSGREVFDFASVAEMASTSTAVVEAEVVDVQPGRTMGSEEAGGVDQARDVTLSVKTSFKRPFVSAPSTIVLEEWGWDEEGRGYQVENVAWSKVGDKGFYFLSKSEAEGRWRLVNTQGRGLISPEGWLTSSANPESDIYADMRRYDSLELSFELKRLLDPKNPAADLPKPHAEPDGLVGDAANEPAPEDGVEEPFPDDTVDDGSEPAGTTGG